MPRSAGIPQWSTLEMSAADKHRSPKRARGNGQLPSGRLARTESKSARRPSCSSGGREVQRARQQVRSAHPWFRPGRFLGLRWGGRAGGGGHLASPIGLPMHRRLDSSRTGRADPATSPYSARTSRRRLCHCPARTTRCSHSQIHGRPRIPSWSRVQLLSVSQWRGASTSCSILHLRPRRRRILLDHRCPFPATVASILL